MNLKKITTIAALSAGMISILAFSFACKKDPDLQGLPEEEEPVTVVTIESDIITPVEEEPEEDDYEETKEGFVRSELTNEWIDEKLEKQRPVAIMVDNELTALEHFGVNQSDVVYELMNSTANGRITRLMCLVKDYEKIEQFGSIRSTRTTNVMLSGEWNAILVHDGGPFYIDNYIGMPYCNNLSGGFARYSNGKPSEFTEYVTYESYTNPSTGKSFAGLGERIEKAGYSVEYNKYYEGKHWSFAPKGDNKIEDNKDGKKVVDVDLPFPHNKSQLKYNEEKKEYEYYEYGKAHIDALDGETTSFTNVILECISFTQLDVNGYLTYNVTDSTSHEGYYLSRGIAVPITWSKATPEGITHYYYKSSGDELELNTGKTYIAFVPADSWDQLEMK
ncbi:MAG: DUF3048 domain-containing protein [Lachnospiraceae bacterium]|nr:DUF3048 domain-containing protein [Lachnospiraceae bacterium]MBR5066457.1 DUF3048 domain-containing protein [Lachnospiraceae bacterium]MBR5917485.1 DUF3048 domain-containing protein [Lachnospiraceae bacterium]